MGNGLASVALSASSDGAVKASPSGAGTSTVELPCNPAPEAASAVRAGERRLPLHHMLNRLAAAAR